ncbi:MAG TPA: hypothetical protein VKB80_24500 [Kofleriaceae bacterium]|nr:hypothetical protein [Kofleriaceae bacterium]
MVATPRIPLRLVLLLCLAGCGGVQEGGGADAGADAGDDGDGADAGMDASGGVDAGDDAGAADADVADAACLPRAIFLGGTAPEDQGWTVTSSGSANVSTAGPSITTLETQTIGGTTGSQLLISLADAVEPDQPFAVELVMQVMAVNTHNFLDGAAVLMGSYSGGFGNGDDRAEMLYVDAVEIGWTDDTQSAAADAIDGMFHTYVLAVDAAGNATVSRDDVELLGRAGFVTNGTIAFGDQTNDPNIESTLWIRSVTLLCP